MEAQISPARDRKMLSAKVTLALVLGSETAFFATLVMSYLYLRTGQTGWPYLHPSITRMSLPALNTLVLLASAGVARRAGSEIRRGSVSGMQHNLFIAALLGLLFVSGQVAEFTRAGMHPSDPAFGGVFFALMGFHGLHVLTGVLALGLSLLRARLGDFDQEHHIAVDGSIWFWFYVVGVWLVLFAVLYLV